MSSRNVTIPVLLHIGDVLRDICSVVGRVGPDVLHYGHSRLVALRLMHSSQVSPHSVRCFALADMDVLFSVDVEHDEHLGVVVIVVPVFSTDGAFVRADKGAIQVRLQLVLAYGMPHLVTPAAPIEFVQLGDLQGSGAVMRGDFVDVRGTQAIK
jgi:hypothetical protein